LRLSFRQKVAVVGFALLASTWAIETYLHYYEPELLKLWISRYVYFNPAHPTFGLSITTILGLLLLIYATFFAKKKHLKLGEH